MINRKVYLAKKLAVWLDRKGVCHVIGRGHRVVVWYDCNVWAFGVMPDLKAINHQSNPATCAPSYRPEISLGLTERVLLALADVGAFAEILRSVAPAKRTRAVH